MFDFLLIVTLSLLCAVTINLLFINGLLTFILNLGLISLLSAFIFTILDAMDVAFTEAAVGAGVSTALFVIIMRITNSYTIGKVVPSKYQYSKKRMAVILITMLALLGILVESLAYAPIFGNFDNPAHNSGVYAAYVKESYNTFNVPNIVTMVLGSFRGYDTFGEVLVIVIAAFGVFLILKEKNDKDLLNIDDNYGKKGTILSPEGEYVITSAVFTLLPIIFLYGLYVQFHGDYGPGGGFQAGATIASAIILYSVIYGRKIASQFISDNMLLYLLSFGATIYASTGLITYLLGGAFLDYYYLGKDLQHSYHYGLLAIELGVGISVFAAMVLIINQLYRKIIIK